MGGERGSAEDNRLRGRDGRSGYRAYGYGPTGKHDIDEDTDTFKLFRRARIKSWRGYYWVVIVDQATGLPIIAVMEDASQNEYKVTGRLFETLYTLWPDIAAETVAADAGWDHEEEAKTVLTKFALHHLFRAGDNATDRAMEPTGKSDRVLGITAIGEVVCQHGKCHHVGMPAVSRDGLGWGEPAPSGEFRIRVRCPLEAERDQARRAGDHRRERDLAKRSCGKLSVRAELLWRRLGHYPHHPLGREDLFAYRQVAIARLTQVEMLISRVKTLGLANPGAARARMGHLVEHESYMALGCASLTALTLADQRLRHGVTLHGEPGGRPPEGRHVTGIPDTIAVGQTDPHVARRQQFRVIPGGES